MKADRQVMIAPSILSADFGRLGEQVAEAADGGADQIHVDVMDGQFVPNLTIGPLVVEAIKRSTDLPLDIHMMVDAPERFVPQLVDAGADIVNQIELVRSQIANLIQVVEDLAQVGGLEHVDALPRHPEAVGPELHLGHRLLSGDVERRACLGCHVGDHAKNEGRLADAGFTGQQGERARDQSASEDPVDLVGAHTKPAQPLGGDCG